MVPYELPQGLREMTMNRLAIIAGVLLAIILIACQNPTPTSDPGADVHADTHAHGCTADADRHPCTDSDAHHQPRDRCLQCLHRRCLRKPAIGLSTETKSCLMDLFEEDPSVAELFTSGEDLIGPSMLSFLACLTPEEAAALTPPGEGPPPDVAGLACLARELEGAPEKDRILAVLAGADPSGQGLTLEESTVLGEAVEACGIDTGFGFPGGEANPLAGTEWRLVLVLGSADPPAEVVGGDPTAEFTATDMTGWTGCNSYSFQHTAYRERICASQT